jgi:hypothetical protein
MRQARHNQIVGKTALAGKEPEILLAPNRLTNSVCRHE